MPIPPDYAHSRKINPSNFFNWETTEIQKFQRLKCGQSSRAGGQSVETGTCLSRHIDILAYDFLPFHVETPPLTSEIAYIFGTPAERAHTSFTTRILLLRL